MAATNLSFTHASVNGGVAVDMNGSKVTYTVQNMIDHVPEQGSTDIATVNVGGFGENPVIVIEGEIDVESSSSNVITQSLLLDFKQVQTPITVVIAAGTTPVYLKGRPSGATYSIGGSYQNQFSAYVKDFVIDFAPTESKEGHHWHYQVTLVETKD